MHASGASLFVGGTGGGNYSKIQYAIDNASSGDTIYVFDGDYYEMLVINKSVSITGNGSATTRIYNDTGGYLIEIAANDVNISGLTIDGMNKMSVGLYLNHSDNCKANGNNIKNPVKTAAITIAVASWFLYPEIGNPRAQAQKLLPRNFSQ